MRARPYLAFVLACALVVGAASAQYYPYGYPYDPTMGGMYYGMPAVPGYDPTLGGTYTPTGDIMADLQAQQAYYMAQMDQIGQNIQAQIEQYNKYFIDLYRTTTGDTTSPDAYALEAGKAIHCQRYPLDCQLAAQGSQAAQAAQQARFDSWMTGVKERDAANDAAFNAWMQQQAAQQESHNDWLRGAILGVDQYADPNTGTAYFLPYAPSQGTYYQTPAGLPLVFDASRNTWYQIEVDGTYTPYYQVP